MTYVVELNMLMSTKQRVTRRTILGDYLIIMHMIIMVLLIVIFMMIVVRMILMMISSV